MGHRVQLLLQNDYLRVKKSRYIVIYLENLLNGAPGGNRTRIASLGSWSSTTELQMQILYLIIYYIFIFFSIIIVCMEIKEIEIEEEKPVKKYKKHPMISLGCLAFSLLLMLIATSVIYIKDFEKVYSCLYIISILLFLIAHNTLLKFKGFYFFIYPIIVIYMLISTYAFSNEMVLFQFPIIAFICNMVFVIQGISDFIKEKKLSILIFSIIIFIISGTLISIFFLDHRIVNTGFCISFILIIIYKIISFYFDYKNNIDKE